MKKIYLIIAFICIFCFSSKAVLAVESMPIYYEDVKFGYDADNKLQISLDWIGPDMEIWPLVGFNGLIQYNFSSNFWPDETKDVSMTFEEGRNNNIYYADWLLADMKIDVKNGEHYDFPVNELHRWTPEKGLFWGCGPWSGTICQIYKWQLEGFLGREFLMDDYITIALYTRDFNYNDPVKYYFDSDKEKPSNIIFSDDFNDNSIDSAKWTTTGTRVFEQNGVMNVNTDITDGGGNIFSTWISVNGTQPISVTRRTIQHYSNKYFTGTFRLMFDTDGDGIENMIFGVEHANNSYYAPIPYNYCSRYGFFLGFGSIWCSTNQYNPPAPCYDDVMCSVNLSPAMPAKWDEWFTEELVYDPVSGILGYSMDGVLKMTQNVGALDPTAKNVRMKLWSVPWGWGTGHYEKFDDIVAEQAIGTTQPANPSEIKQYLADNETEILEGNTINEDAVIIRAKVYDADNDRVKIKASLYKFDEESNDALDVIVKESDFADSNGIASILFDNLEEGDYSWKIQAIDERGGESDIVLFGEPSLLKADFKFYEDFSFIHLTDVHLGSNLMSYTRFTDALYELKKASPDFILLTGDVFDYANEEWVLDFQSLTSNYSIPIYIIPGNHDRYRKHPLQEVTNEWLNNWIENNNFDDNLNKFSRLAVSNNSPKADKISFLFDEEEMTGEQGRNKYNYFWKHKGYLFIGLDSGEDTDIEIKDWKGDNGPEGNGLSEEHLNILKSFNKDIPKIIFMHHPLVTGEQDDDCSPNLLGDIICPSDNKIIEDASIANNREKFIDFATSSQVQLVLAGHTHEDMIFETTGERPLSIQTRSATKGDNYGYRIIDVEDKIIKPRNSQITQAYPKIIGNTDLFDILEDEKNEIAPSVEFIAVGDAFFNANSSKKTFVYDYDKNNSIFELKKIDDLLNENEKYGVSLLLVGKDVDSFTRAFKVDENNLFGWYAETDYKHRPFIEIIADYSNGIEIKIEKAALKYQDNVLRIAVNWDELISTKGYSGITLLKSFSGDGGFEESVTLEELTEMPYKIFAVLGSPAELRVYDEYANVTGLVDNKIKEGMPYSTYHSEDEKVIIFSDDAGNNNYKYEVAGTADDTYDLEIKSEKDGEDAVIFKADAIKINVGINHKYSINWEALKNNEDGVTLEIDNDGDGQYEHSANISSEFSDKIAPVSKIFVNGEAVGGWINVVAGVSFYAEDNEGGIGVEKIEYSLDGGLIWIEYSEPFVIGDEGIHNIVYRATDYFGNQEEIKSADIKIDMTSPEAKIFASINNADLEIKGMDNLTSIATVWENDNICTITDEAGNFIRLDFDKIKEKKKLVQAKIDKIEYGDGAKSFLPKNHLIYTWAMPNNILLNQIIEVKNEFNVSARYDKKSDQTIVKYRDSGNKKIESRFDGLKILELFTARGKLNYQF